MDFEGPCWHSAVHGKNKPMEPFAIGTINNKYVAAPPSQTNGSLIGAFVLPHDVQVGHNVFHRPWLTDLMWYNLWLSHAIMSFALNQYPTTSDLVSLTRKIKSGPQVGLVATSPLPCRGSPTLQSGGKSGPQVGSVQKWPTSGQIGYILGGP